MTKDTPRLEEAVAFHNGVTQWTICNIMKEFTPGKRADVIVKFIDVAQVNYFFIQTSFIANKHFTFSLFMQVRNDHLTFASKITASFLAPNYTMSVSDFLL